MRNIGPEMSGSVEESSVSEQNGQRDKILLAYPEGQFVGKNCEVVLILPG
jgi:hypothetical protein